MTKKTFTSAWPKHPRRINVRQTKDGVNVRISDPVLDDQKGITLAPTDTPALALAILEAAGYEERQKSWDVLNSADENFAQAMRCLSKGLELQDRATAEARERAELEAEALELHNAFWDVWDRNHIDSWDDQPGKAKNAWVSAARRARELAKEATK